MASIFGHFVGHCLQNYFTLPVPLYSSLGHRWWLYEDERETRKGGEGGGKVHLKMEMEVGRGGRQMAMEGQQDEEDDGLMYFLLITGFPMNQSFHNLLSLSLSYLFFSQEKNFQIRRFHYTHKKRKKTLYTHIYTHT
ncbi:hypothetical protein L6452_33985 [Arctium lappa]|uniref:Uncharacterized protein n=1 Tax=Arctium lappa TaxID=4217 RepID=A0ACB8YIJ3_ARCLA|nr:hypothetical protein L6452_33985 [Arctium lappa]